MRKIAENPDKLSGEPLGTPSAAGGPGVPPSPVNGPGSTAVRELCAIFADAAAVVTPRGNSTDAQRWTIRT